jgi:hypothetical protein
VAAARVRALADQVVLVSWVGSMDTLEQAQRALTIARELDDPALLTRALIARGCITSYDPRRPGRPGR